MSDNGKCPDCGTPYGIRRRCYKCKPGHPTRPKELSLDEIGEMEDHKAIAVPNEVVPPESRIDKREMLRQAMAERAAAERQKVREERAEPPKYQALAPRMSSPVLLKTTEADDPEIAAITSIFGVLKRLDDKARDRVLVYIRERFSCGF